MNSAALIKIVITAVIGLVIASAASMNEDVTTNKVRIDRMEKSINKMSTQINEIHWHFIRRSRE